MRTPPISLEDVRTTARLAHLALSDAELQQLTTELLSVLDHAAALQAIDVSGVPPTTHAVPLPCPLREDRVGPHDAVESALRNAPARESSFFAVPAIFAAGGGEDEA